MTQSIRTAQFAVALLVAVASMAIGMPQHASNGGTAAAQAGAQADRGFVVTAVEMPPIAMPGWFNATATIENQGATDRTADVAFRFEGGQHDVVSTRSLTVPGDSMRRVTFALNTTGFEPDDYVAGVTTANSSELEEITLSTTADIDFDPQETNGTSVVVDSMFLPRGGYVAVHNSSRLEGPGVDSIIGASGYLPPGYHQEVTVRLYDVPGARYDVNRLTADEPLVAVAHRETTGDRTFAFVRSDGTDDGPYLDGPVPVAETSEVTVVETNATATSPSSPSR